MDVICFKTSEPVALASVIKNGIREECVLELGS